MIIFLVLWIAIIVILGVYWSRELGPIRGALAALFRAGWTLPVILSLAPQTVTKRIPGSVASQPIHVLVDDSDSMSLPDAQGSTARSQASDLLKRVDDVCLQFGCVPKITKLSDLASDTKKGFTPLSRVVEPWLYKTGGEPWMLLSDGGDFRPSNSWDQSLEGRGRNIALRGKNDQLEKTKSLGLVVTFGRPRIPGFSVESVSLAPLAFEGKTVALSASVARLEPESQGAQRVQVQVLLDGKVLTSSEADFAVGASSADVELTFAAPKRGPHIVTVKALAVAGELDTWDNSQTRVLDVMPNTVGVLHLLGSPAWDGRFMRRFLKAEPKFDVISFFILRDPWDSQQVSEREMSLIPFPVERLFKEELVNFRVIVMQNFTLMRFLQPEYQENLAKFVKDGGGLLFIGGPRALTETDVSSSSLAGLLPFTVQPTTPSANRPVTPGGDMNDALNGMGSSWDPEARFTVEMAAPEDSRRALANVYEGWQGLNARLAAVQDMRGIHDMASIKFRDSEITPLLNARLKSGKTVPLAVASYPGKGRALWIFTDSLWRLAMSADQKIARSDYNSFMDAALSWLTRGDMRGALTVRDFKVSQVGDQSDKLKWQAVFYGSAARYLKTATTSRLSVCGIGVQNHELHFGGVAGDSISVEGEIGASIRDGALCSLKLDIEHPAFGSLSVTGWTVIPETLNDASMGPSPLKLGSLAKLSGARLVTASSERGREVEAWVQLWGAADGVALPDKMKSSREFYWPQDYSWFWIVLVLLPAEVLIRRWHLISGGVRTSDKRRAS